MCCSIPRKFLLVRESSGWIIPTKMRGQIKKPVQAVPQNTRDYASLSRNVWEAGCFWSWKGALQVASKTTTNSLISSALSSKIFSQGSYLDVSSLILFLFIPVKFSWHWSASGLSEDALFIISKAMSTCYSLECASFAPAEGHSLFFTGYNLKKNSFTLYQRVYKSQGTGIESVCYSCGLPAHIVTREDRLGGRQMWRVNAFSLRHLTNWRKKKAFPSKVLGILSALSHPQHGGC